MSQDLRIGVDEVAGLVARLRAADVPMDRALQLIDLSRLEARARQLRNAFPGDALHAVAVKAMPLVSVLRRLGEWGMGCEAASWEEVALAVAAGVPGDRIVFDGPAKTDEELRRAIELGCWINADHERELERLAAWGAPGNSRIGIRVNPGIGAGSIAFTSTVSASSKFGVPLSEAERLIERFPFVTGLHVHTGSQGCGLDLLSAAAARTAEVAARLGLTWLDIGGGLPVRYTEADPQPPTVEAWAAGVAQTQAWGRMRLLTEVGRWMHSGGGITLSRIEAVKEVAGQPMLVVHVGADLLLRRVYRPDDWDHELIVLDPDGVPREGPRVPTTVAGPLCFSGDLLAKNRRMPEAREGDLLLIRDTGAYTLSMWSRHCSRGLPPVWGLDQDGVHPLFGGESAEDVVRFWS